ncbi:hypothetical protein HAZT_HAZT010371 [Hyalella azteca]|uniref:AAA+ ATPase domain-containing protein n=1 Tax=Hyalella azteca TaxID=294128 RepID=A0A6A0H5B1_HYAAZ|nr:hypothetical protein HAZT_HAZT010371 [Hyalella azteca]
MSAENFSVCEDSDLDSVLSLYERWYCDKFERYPRFAKRATEKVGDSGVQTPPNSVGRKPPPDLTEHNRVGGDVRSRGSPDIKTLDHVLDNRRKHNFIRKPLVGRRSPGDEKRDRTKSSSDSDSDKGNRSAPGSGNRSNISPFQPLTPAKMGHQILDLKSMIRDYTRLEDNIGDIGRGKKPGADATKKATEASQNGEENGEDLLDERVVKGPGSEIPPSLTGDLKDLAMSILREVVVENPAVSWGDVLGVEDAKKLLKEAVVYPLKYPQLFVGRFKPWRGVLLYGPPGTGKTLLAKAVATECKTTFFNISATTLVSKWRGDSEKLVRVLFEMARHHAPSTIFVDELDALMGSRAGDQEHEASRRMKTQLLVELDGLTATNEHVFLLAASNIPWELDPAMLRRLEKRILVPLPSAEARSAMFMHHLPPDLLDLAEAGHTVSTHLDYNHLAQMSEGYSGSDLKIVCREAAMMSLRKIFKVLEDRSVDDDDLPELQLEDITMRDVETALARTKPAQQDSQQYIEWHEKFGSV